MHSETVAIFETDQNICKDTQRWEHNTRDFHPDYHCNAYIWHLPVFAGVFIEHKISQPNDRGKN